MQSPFPEYRFSKLILDHTQLRYNPTGEWIFPSPFHAGRHLAEPLAEWYLYYSPHDAPGGICLAMADTVDGPYSEHPATPIITKDWEPHYSVSHVASPHPLWVPSENKVFLYFHGENDVTRYASSSDGINFHYEGVALTGADSAASLECSYARVFEHQNATLGSNYVFLCMGHIAGRRHIYFAHSSDARTWTARETPLIWSREEFGGQTSAPFLVNRAGELYVIHHCDLHQGYGNIFATPVSPDFREVGETRMIFRASQNAPDCGRVGDPFPVYLDGPDGEMSLIYCAGERLKGVMALAKPV